MKKSSVFSLILFALIIFSSFSSESSQASQQSSDSRPRRATIPGPRLTMEEIKNYETAIDKLKKLVMSVPYYFDGYYNVARLYSQLGKKSEGLDWLEQAIDKGMIDSELISSDPQIEYLRTDPAYRNIASKAAAKNREMAKSDRPEVLLFSPNAESQKDSAPLLIVLHGEGENANSSLDLWRNIARKHGFVLAVPQGSYMVALGHYQWGTRGEGEALINLALERAMEKYKIDKNRVYLMGFSQGGYISLTVGLNNSDRFAGVIALSTPYVGSLVESKLEEAKKRNFRVYIGNGAGGFPNLIVNNREAKERLVQAGLKVELKLYKSTGHAFPPNPEQELEQALIFISK